MKKSTILWVILLMIAAVGGVCTRLSYTNILKDKGEGYFQVALLGEYAKEETFANLKAEILNAPYIFRVKSNWREDISSNFDYAKRSDRERDKRRRRGNV